MSELTILYPIRKSPDWLVFMCAVVHGLDNFRWISERSRAFRSGKVSGFIETWRNVGPGEDDKFNVELFSPFEAELISIISAEGTCVSCGRKSINIEHSYTYCSARWPCWSFCHLWRMPKLKLPARF